MGYLIIPLGTRQPAEGIIVGLGAGYYHHEHPRDLYGNALIIPCEYQPDTPATKDTPMRNPSEADYLRWAGQISAIQQEVEQDIPDGQYPPDLECALRLAWLAAFNGAEECRRAEREAIT